jgi:hypothetical protein
MKNNGQRMILALDKGNKEAWTRHVTTQMDAQGIQKLTRKAANRSVDIAGGLALDNDEGRVEKELISMITAAYPDGDPSFAFSKMADRAKLVMPTPGKLPTESEETATVRQKKELTAAMYTEATNLLPPDERSFFCGMQFFIDVDTRQVETADQAKIRMKTWGTHVDATLSPHHNPLMAIVKRGDFADVLEQVNRTGTGSSQPTLNNLLLQFKWELGAVGGPKTVVEGLARNKSTAHELQKFYAYVQHPDLLQAGTLEAVSAHPNPEYRKAIEDWSIHGRTGKIVGAWSYEVVKGQLINLDEVITKRTKAQAPAIGKIAQGGDGADVCDYDGKCYNFASGNCNKKHLKHFQDTTRRKGERGGRRPGRDGQESQTDDPPGGAPTAGAPDKNPYPHKPKITNMTEQRAYLKSIVCHGCKETGHYYRMCPNTVPVARQRTARAVEVNGDAEVDDGQGGYSAYFGHVQDFQTDLKGEEEPAMTLEEFYAEQEDLLDAGHKEERANESQGSASGYLSRRVAGDAGMTHNKSDHAWSYAATNAQLGTLAYIDDAASHHQEGSREFIEGRPVSEVGAPCTPFTPPKGPARAREISSRVSNGVPCRSSFDTATMFRGQAGGSGSDDDSDDGGATETYVNTSDEEPDAQGDNAGGLTAADMADLEGDSDENPKGADEPSTRKRRRQPQIRIAPFSRGGRGLRMTTARHDDSGANEVEDDSEVEGPSLTELPDDPESDTMPPLIPNVQVTGEAESDEPQPMAGAGGGMGLAELMARREVASDTLMRKAVRYTRGGYAALEDHLRAKKVKIDKAEASMITRERRTMERAEWASQATTKAQHQLKLVANLRDIWDEAVGTSLTPQQKSSIRRRGVIDEQIATATQQELDIIRRTLELDNVGLTDHARKDLEEKLAGVTGTLAALRDERNEMQELNGRLYRAREGNSFLVAWDDVQRRRGEELDSRENGLTLRERALAERTDQQRAEHERLRAAASNVAARQEGLRVIGTQLRRNEYLIAERERCLVDFHERLRVSRPNSSWTTQCGACQRHEHITIDCRWTCPLCLSRGGHQADCDLGVKCRTIYSNTIVATHTQEQKDRLEERARQPGFVDDGSSPGLSNHPKGMSNAQLRARDDTLEVYGRHAWGNLVESLESMSEDDSVDVSAADHGRHTADAPDVATAFIWAATDASSSHTDNPTGTSISTASNEDHAKREEEASQDTGITEGDEGDPTDPSTQPANRRLADEGSKGGL